jgi:hypothetical protein
MTDITIHTPDTTQIADIHTLPVLEAFSILGSGLEGYPKTGAKEALSVLRPERDHGG